MPNRPDQPDAVIVAELRAGASADGKFVGVDFKDHAGTVTRYALTPDAADALVRSLAREIVTAARRRKD